MPEIDVATIVMRGSSFDIANLDQLKPPVYLVCARKQVQGDGVWYAAADEGPLTSWQDQGLPVLCVEISWTDLDGQRHVSRVPGLDHVMRDPRNQRITIHYKLPLRDVPMLNSGLACILALSKFAKRVDVYGWDFYFKSAPNEMSSWGVLWGIFESYYYVEATLYNLHYANRLSRLPNVNLHGYLGDLSRHKRLVRGLERFYYTE